MNRLNEIENRLLASESASGSRWVVHGLTIFGGYAVHAADPTASVCTAEYLPEESAELFANSSKDLSLLLAFAKKVREIYDGPEFVEEVMDLLSDALNKLENK